MAYCTLEDYENWFVRSDTIRRTDDSIPPVGIENHVLISKAIEFGAAKIDSYIGARVSLPLSEPYPVDFVDLNMRLARYTLANRIGRVGIEIKEDYDACMATLKDYRDGKLAMPQALMATQTMGQVLSYSPDRIFTERILSYA